MQLAGTPVHTVSAALGCSFAIGETPTAGAGFCGVIQLFCKWDSSETGTADVNAKH
jgi:hypothetical protein